MCPMGIVIASFGRACSGPESQAKGVPYAVTKIESRLGAPIRASAARRRGLCAVGADEEFVHVGEMGPNVSVRVCADGVELFA